MPENALPQNFPDIPRSYLVALFGSGVGIGNAVAASVQPTYVRFIRRITGVTSQVLTHFMRSLLSNLSPHVITLYLSTYSRVSQQVSDIGWVDFDLLLFHLLPISAWADGKLPELAEQVCKMVKLHKSKSTQRPNHGQRAAGTPCRYMEMNDEEH